nr:hypothetical protein [Tanacetum cinerariifolium]
MSIYKAPTSALKDLESIRKDFFHGADKELVREFTALKSKGIDSVSFIKRKLRNGENTLFWEDIWLGDSALKMTHPRLFALDLKKDITVAEKMGNASLNLSFRRLPRSGIKDEQYMNLVFITSDVILPQMHDRWSWSLNASGDFTWEWEFPLLVFPLDNPRDLLKPNSEALRKCIPSGPYKPTTVLVYAVEATDNSPAVAEHTTVKTPVNMSPENKAHFLAENEAIHLILTGIRDDIYLTVDACQTAQEMWEAIQRLQQEWSRFVTIVKQQHKLDEVSYHKLFDILKQYQNEVNELRAEKLARNANPLALVATAQASQDQYYQTSMSHRSSAPSPKPSILSRSYTSTRHKGKEIGKPITPPSKTASEEDSDPKQAQRDKDMQKNLALIAKYFKKIYKPTNNNLRTSSNSKNKNVDTTLRYKNDGHSGQFETQRTVNVAGPREKVGSSVVQKSGIQCYNCKEYGHFAKECRKPKRVKDSAYHKEKMLLCKQAEQGVPLQAEQYDCNTCLVETDDTNAIPDSPDMCEDDIQNDQNDVESDDEHVVLANLNANLKLDVDENKKIQKQLKKANTTLAQELKECKTILAKTSKSLRESISVRDSYLVALQTKKTEF